MYEQMKKKKLILDFSNDPPREGSLFIHDVRDL